MGSYTLEKAIAEAIAIALDSCPERAEQRAVALLYQQGWMANLSCAEQRDVESSVRAALSNGEYAQCR